MAEPGMFFLFGSPRSGTSLLAGCLDLHPEICIPDETDFIVPLCFVLDRVRDPSAGKELLRTMIPASNRFQAGIGRHLSAQELGEAIDRADYTAASLLASIYSAVARKAGKKLAGDKSPNDLNFIQMILKTGALDSGARVIHIVRDIRGVLNSLVKTGWASGLEGYYPRLWSHVNLLLHDRLRSRPESYLLVRYEELVARPSEVLARACAFLGREFDPGMLRPEERGLHYRELPHHGRLGKEISGSQLLDWESELSPSAQEECLIQASEALGRFGYRPTHF